MNIELSIIKLLLSKENYDKFGQLIYNIETEQEVKKVLLAISRYYEAYDHHNFIAVDELTTYFYTHYPSDKANTKYAEIFLALSTLEVSDSLGADIVRKYLEKDTAGKIMEAILPVMNGEGSGVLDIPQLVDTYKEQAQLVDEEASPWIEDNLDGLMDLIDKRDGLEWGLKHLNRNIGPLPGCTLGHVFARVEAGKTTFIAGQVQSWLSSITDEQSILWVCNEEHGRFVKLRTYQSLLNKSNDELKQDILAGRQMQLEDDYNNCGGDRINIHYDPNVSVEMIRALLEKNPGTRVVVIDIADHVRFRGDGDLSGPARLGELYRKYRGMAAFYGVDIITVGQASAECEGRKILQLDHMHNSKTDKPGALDYVIGVGKTNSPEDAETRWLSIPKNKIGTTEQETESVQIDKLKGRFYDS